MRRRSGVRGWGFLAAVGLPVLALAVDSPFLPAGAPAASRHAAQRTVAVPAGAAVAATPASADRDEQPAATRADASLPDPDGVGRCPRQATSPVVRRGIDVDRWPTWWHADGSLTKRIRQQVGGELVPAVLTMTPASGRQR